MHRFARRLLPLLLAAPWLAGCLSTQLDRNTLSLTATVANLQTQQVIDNLARFIDDPDALPAQTVLSAGTVQVASSTNGGLTYPIDLATKFARSLSGAVNTQWTENWNLVPVTDGGDIRRLRALYRFAVYGNRTGDTPSPERDGPYDFDHGYAPNRAAAPDSPGPHAYTGGAQNLDTVLHTGWLFWSNNDEESEVPVGPIRPSPAPLFRLGQSGSHTLFTNDRAKWSEFVVAVLDATPRTHDAALRGSVGPVSNP